MTNRVKLWMLIDELLKGRIETKNFCDDFNRIYNLEIDYSELSEREHTAFRELNSLAARFSEFEDDFIKYPNVYYSESDVRAAAERIARTIRP